MDKIKYFTFIVFAILMMSGCSGNGLSTTQPEADIPVHQTDSITTSWGYWQFMVDWEKQTIDILPLREADKALNILNLLEPPAGVNLKVAPGSLHVNPATHTISCDVVIKHPLPATAGRFNGFDVRGIVFGPALTNADGKTHYFQPQDFTGTPYGYVDGLLGVPDVQAHYSSVYNGYKYYCNGLGADDDIVAFFDDPSNLAGRGIFTEGSSNTRHYELAFGPNPNKFLVFNYAVYASHAFPQGTPPFEPEDFEATTANQAEPVFAKVTELENTLIYNPDLGTGLGGATLQIDLFDWVKPSSPDKVWVESPGIISQVEAVFSYEVDEHFTRYIATFTGNPVTSGNLDIIITVEDETTYGEHYFMNLMSDSHPLFDQKIVTQFIHPTVVAEYTMFPYVEGFDGVGPEWTLDDNWTLETDNSLINNENETGCYAEFLSEASSPEIPVPDSGENLILMIYQTINVEQNFDEMSIKVNGDIVEPVRGILYNDDYSLGWTGDLGSGWSAFDLGTQYNGGMVTITLASDADGSGSCADEGYIGWQVHHLILGYPTSIDFPPLIDGIDGPTNVGDAGPHHFTADIFDYNGPGAYEYFWETGDDTPAQYDDGPGNGDGSIDITFPAIANYTIDLRIGDVDSMPSYCSHPKTVSYFEVPSNSIIEDFEDPVGSEWAFYDQTTSGYGQYWGQMQVYGSGALDLDGADNGCYGDYLFCEARWTVTIPASTSAILMLAHTINAEDYAEAGEAFDAGFIAIDGTILTQSEFLNGWANNYNDVYFTPNYLYTDPPGSSFSWSGINPSYPNDFNVSYLSISSYADGGSHEISLLFDSDSSASCESGSGYTSWSIDEIAVFYE